MPVFFQVTSGVRWLRTGAISASLLTLLFFVWAWSFNFGQVYVSDYLSYWAAGKLALLGEPAAAWDIAKHRAVESTATGFHGLNPFPYPPPFLLVVAPFSLLPYVWGFAAWIVVTAAVYFVAIRRIVPAPLAFAQPPALINGWIGQNGFVTAAIFASGTAMLGTRPFLAGALLGLMVIKPQLALLLPVAVIAAKEWRAAWGAVFSIAVLLLTALVAFGPASYIGFFKMLPFYTALMREDKWPWNEFISPFAFIRWFGVGRTAALLVHATIALAATAATWLAWSRNWQSRVPILTAASLLVAPYLLTYDALILILPISYLLAHCQRWSAAVTWLLCLFPIIFYFGLYRGPNTIPIAAILSIVLMVRSELSGAEPYGDGSPVSKLN